MRALTFTLISYLFFRSTVHVLLKAIFIINSASIQTCIHVHVHEIQCLQMKYTNPYLHWYGQIYCVTLLYSVTNTEDNNSSNWQKEMKSA